MTWYEKFALFMDGIFDWIGELLTWRRAVQEASDTSNAHAAMVMPPPLPSVNPLHLMNELMTINEARALAGLESFSIGDVLENGVAQPSEIGVSSRASYVGPNGITPRTAFRNAVLTDYINGTISGTEARELFESAGMTTPPMIVSDEMTIVNGQPVPLSQAGKKEPKLFPIDAKRAVQLEG